MIRKNTRACTHGNYVTLLLISNVHKTFYFCGSLFEAVSAIKLLQYVIDNLNLKGKVFFDTRCMPIR